MFHKVEVKKEKVVLAKQSFFFLASWGDERCFISLCCQTSHHSGTHLSCTTNLNKEGLKEETDVKANKISLPLSLIKGWEIFLYPIRSDSTSWKTTSILYMKNKWRKGCQNQERSLYFSLVKKWEMFHYPIWSQSTVLWQTSILKVELKEEIVARAKK